MSRVLKGVVCSAALVLAACGGGGGGGGGQPPLTAITATTAAPTAAVAVRAASALFDVALAGSGAVGVVTEVPSSGGNLGVATFAAKRLKSVLGRTIAPADVAVGAIYNDVEACTGGGSVAVRFNDSDNSGTVTTGDAVRFTFAACVEEGVTANGVLDVSDLQVPSFTSFAARFTFTSFTASDGVDTVGANGGFDLQYGETGNVADFVLDGRSLRSTLNGDVATLTNFVSTATIDWSTGAFAYTFDGGVADSAANVSVFVETLLAFEGNLDDDHPSFGQLLITGLNLSAALLDVLSTTELEIGVDADGSGVYETFIDTTWDALLLL